MQGAIRQKGNLIMSTPRRTDTEGDQSKAQRMNQIKSKDGNLIIIPQLPTKSDFQAGLQVFTRNEAVSRQRTQSRERNSRERSRSREKQTRIVVTRKIAEDPAQNSSQYLNGGELSPQKDLEQKKPQVVLPQ